MHRDCWCCGCRGVVLVMIMVKLDGALKLTFCFRWESLGEAKIETSRCLQDTSPKHLKTMHHFYRKYISGSSDLH
jgi:hypothetical protein